MRPPPSTTHVRETLGLVHGLVSRPELSSHAWWLYCDWNNTAWNGIRFRGLDEVITCLYCAAALGG